MIIGILSATLQTSLAEDKKDMDALKSKYIVLMDYDSGQIIYEKNANHKMYPASTTKVWTAFCVLEKAKNLDQIIEVKDLPEIEGTCMYLEKGEKFTVRELLTSMLVHSSNDVSYLLAQYYGDGNPKNFIDFMNSEAKKYGAKNTHFNNPHGLPDTNHYSTAHDMTLLARVAYSDTTIQKIVSMKKAKFPKTDNVKVERDLINSNKFLNSTETMNYKGKDVTFKYDAIDGMKTGFTDDAGNCLLATGKKNGVRMISGVFFAPAGSLYHDSRFVLDYGFDNFKNQIIFKKENFKGSKNLSFAKPGKINYMLASDFSVTSTKAKNINKKDYSTKLDFDNIELPVEKGDIIGRMNVYEKGKMVSSIGLIATSSSQSFGQYLWSKLPFVNNDKKKDVNENKSKQEKNNQLDKKSAKERIQQGKDQIKNGASESVTGVLAIGDSIKDGISDKNILGKFENTSFYKFLEDFLSTHLNGIPPKIIIYGLPLLILLLILILIVLIIKDAIADRKDRKLDYQDDIYNIGSDDKKKIKTKKDKIKKKSKILKSQSKPDKK